jgi:CRISPR-associated protein Cmr4
MKAQIWGFLAESPVHAGSGQATGFVDLPVSREAATHHPIIPGSSIKGALRDLARQRRRARGEPLTPAPVPEPGQAAPAPRSEIERAFGAPAHAGDALISDARLVLLPVRSMTSIYRWITCPYVIERLVRDRKRAGHETTGLDTRALRDVTPGQALMAHDAALFLEERLFARRGGLPRGLVDLVGGLIMHADTRARLDAQLVVLHDDDFGWFARYGLAVVARNHLDETNKTSENLWYEEALPPDTVLYALLAERGQGGLDTLRALFEESPYLQVGGNETVGQGWLAVTLPGTAMAATPGGAK